MVSMAVSKTAHLGLNPSLLVNFKLILFTLCIVMLFGIHKKNAFN